MTNLTTSPDPYHIEFDRGLALALLEEPGSGPAGQRVYRLETARRSTDRSSLAVTA